MVTIPKTTLLTIEELIKHFELCNLAGGKSPKTIMWYNDILFSFHKYLKRNRKPNDVTSFNINNVRGYILYLRQKSKFDTHPYTPTQD